VHTRVTMPNLVATGQTLPAYVRTYTEIRREKNGPSRLALGYGTVSRETDKPTDRWYYDPFL